MNHLRELHSFERLNMPEFFERHFGQKFERQPSSQEQEKYSLSELALLQIFAFANYSPVQHPCQAFLGALSYLYCIAIY